MDIAPHAWLLLAPLTAGLIALYRLPPQSRLTALWRDLLRIEAMGILYVTGRAVDYEAAGHRRIQRHALRFAIVLCAAGTLFSVALQLTQL